MRKGPCVQQVWLRRAAGLLRVPRQRGFSSILPEHQRPVPDQLHHLRERGLRSGDPPLRVRVLPRCRHAAAAVHRHPVLHELSLPGRHVLRPRVYAATHAGAVRQLQDAAPGAVQPGLMSQVRRHPRGLPRAAASGRDLRLLRSDQCPLHVGLRLLLGGLQRDSQQLPVDARVSRVSNEGAGAVAGPRPFLGLDPVDLRTATRLEVGCLDHRVARLPGAEGDSHARLSDLHRRPVL